MKESNVFDRWNLKWFQRVGIRDEACLCVPFSGARTCRMSRGGMAPEKKRPLTAASVACALDTVPGADRIHWTALPGGRKAAQAGNPVHMAEMAALVLLATMAGSRAAAGAVR